MAKGRTLKIQAVNNGLAMLTEHPQGAEATTYFIPSDWLARDQVSGTLVRATEEMPGVVRFRAIANPDWTPDPAEHLGATEPEPTRKLREDWMRDPQDVDAVPEESDYEDPEIEPTGN
jgi:hypothetical protein